MRELKPGIYRHFKGNYYQVLGQAMHTETGELLAVYQAMYPPFGLFARPVDMFLSEIDRAKYPDAPGTYRFEYLGPVGVKRDG